jgi:hypothetical protein
MYGQDQSGLMIKLTEDYQSQKHNDRQRHVEHLLMPMATLAVTAFILYGIGVFSTRDWLKNSNHGL